MWLLDIPQSSLLPLDCAYCAPPAEPRGRRPVAKRLRGGRVRQAIRQRVAQRRRCQASEGMRQRVSPPPNHEVYIIRAGEVGWQVTTKLLDRHRCLTLAFSGAVSGIEREYKNRAARPPLQRLVGPHSAMPLLYRRRIRTRVVATTSATTNAGTAVNAGHATSANASERR